jgi:membrane protein YqaA with SNARE-associated domain
MHDFLLNNGLTALFALSFLAATILPLGSEWLLVALILQGVDPVPAVAVATVGNFLGACTTYAMGFWGSTFVLQKLLRIGEKDISKAERIFEKYGSWALLLAWLPVVGDPLCLVAGSLRLNLLRFSCLVFAGKLGRYAFIAALTTMSSL